MRGAATRAAAPAAAGRGDGATGLGPGRWAHRLAVITAGATLGLIVAGGLVTNTGAALAVPDWPTTFGHNMFLYPWSGMVGGVFYEHSHRLLGALVGLLTLGLAAALWPAEGPGWLRGLGLAAVALVSVQGLLGGLRVLLLRDTLAIVHGCVAQAFFALVVALAVFTSAAWRDPRPRRESGPAWPLAVAAVAALYGQIVVGALATHAGWIRTHMAGAVVALVIPSVLTCHALARRPGGPTVTRLAGGLGALLVLQVALGLGAYVTRFTGLALPGGAPVALALPVLHRATGALLLGTAVALALHAWRWRPRAAASADVAGEARVFSVDGRPSACGGAA